MEATFLIINSKASRAEKNRDAIVECAMSAGVPKENTHWVDDPSDLSKQLKQVLKQDPESILVAGGDGTVISIIQAALDADYSGAFGIIPVGTSNYLARNLNLPLNIRESFQVINSQRGKNIHLGVVNEQVFSLMTTVGVTTQVSENVSVALKQRVGQIAYIAEALRQLRKTKSFEYEISIDGEGTSHAGIAHELIVANANLSQQVHLAPRADVHKPQLQVTIFNTNGNIVRLLLSIFISIFTLGKIQRGVTTFECDTSLHIITRPTLSASVDGEVVAETPLSISILDEAPRILVP